MKAWWIFSILFIPHLLSGQIDNISYGGRLTDALVGHPISGASVSIEMDGKTQTVTTAENGSFQFAGLAAGNYRLTIQSLGYESLTVAEVAIHTGVPREQTFSMVPADHDLQEIVVKAPSRDRASQSFTSIHTLTVEETFRFPGTFYDPARLATHFPGVINDNDQANNLVIRGNSPNFLGWYLEDVEIVNPNHNSNAGTLNDRPTQSGGGVNILSAQMIDNTAFLKSAFPATYGNALSGVMDMHLRQGARDQLHFTGQIGLNGIDAAVEGPFSEDSDGSFLINYRYSTLGLLSAMGVDLGDEQFNFQDLSFHLKFPLGNRGSISIFGMGGTSKTEFEGTADETLWEEFKDRQNILFESKMGALGVSVHHRQWKTTVAFSGNSHKRLSSLILSQAQTSSFERDLNEEGRLALHSRNRFTVGKSSFIDVGVRVNRIKYNNLFARDFLEISSSARDEGWHLQAYASSKWTLLPKLSLIAGLQASHFTLNEASAIEPRLGLRQWLSNKSKISFSYGLHSRLPSQNAFFITDGNGNNNSDLDFIRSHHLVLGFDHALSTTSKISTEIYYQHLFNLPVGNGSKRSFSTINAIDYVNIQDLVSEGTGENMGVDLSYEKYFANETYFQLNTSLFDSKYTALDGVERNTRYNAKYAVNLTGGKEFTWHRQNKIKNIGLNIRVYNRGGFWEGPININASQSLLTTIYDEELAFTEQLPAFFKIDFRIHYKRTKEKYTSILGLDILNATNQENIAYYFYNPINQSILTKNHLGIIPILSYRIEY